jgi:hypothetical protein
MMTAAQVDTPAPTFVRPDASVILAIVLGEIGRRYVAGRRFAQAHDARSVLAKKVGPEAAGVQVRGIPRGAVVVVVHQVEHLNRLAEMSPQ